MSEASIDVPWESPLRRRLAAKRGLAGVRVDTLSWQGRMTIDEIVLE